MKNKNELNFKDLKMTCNSNIFNFETTQELKDITTGIGQERGIKALEFGLQVDVKGYNLYIEGPSGVGKTMYTKNYLNKISKKQKTPNDWCYIYNFDNPNEPIAVSLPAGQGKEFKNAMDGFILEVKKDIKKTFNADDFEKEKALLKQEFEEKRSSILDKLNVDASKHNFQVKSSQNGIYMMPIVNGKAIDEEEFDKLDDEIKQVYEEKSSIVQAQIMDAIEQIKIIERQSDKKISEWQSNIALLTINVHINYLKSQFKRNKKITKFLNDVKQDVLKNVSYFVDEDKEKEKQQQMNPAQRKQDPSLNYRVNLFVDNSNTEGAPVIMDSNYSYHNIFGTLEYENYYGSLKTDHTMLKPGLLQQANGGYIIFHASDMVGNAFAWDTLRKILKTGTVTIEPLKEYQLGGITVSAIRPETTEVNVKVILVGSLYYYEMLKEYDDDFSKLFKMCVLFDYEMDYNKKNIDSVVSFVNNFVSKENLKPIDKNAIRQLVEYSTRVAERQDKMTTRFGTLGDVLIEANTWANMDGLDTINEKCVLKAINKRIERVNIYAEKYIDMIKENEILIDTTGEKVGQINGLCVMEMDDYTFGMPTRITASTYTGKAGIVNIEKEAEMSGSIHDKGVQVCIGYLGGKYAQKFPLTLSCRVCFEQSYNGVDGDSATSTETYCILSSLSGLPIRQDLAVTGSMNQRGEIQPIGGVTYKIEGFYNICKNKGLTGTQGVIIPRSNIKDMVLSDEVVESVKNKQFHIYAIDNVDDGIELLMGQKAGKALASGGFSKDSVHSKVYNKLKNYYKISVQE